MNSVNINSEELKKTAHKYRKELLMMPIHGLNRSLAHMSLRPGIRYAETVGELSGDLQFAPYSETREDNDEVIINPRTLYTYFGSVVRNFSPNKIYQSMWGSSITKGEGLKSTEITLKVVSYLCGKLGYNLNKSLWNAVRNDAGSKTVDLFNGFDTITAAEITAGKIAEAAGNLFIIPEKITPLNAVEQLKAIYRGAHDELRDLPCKLFIPQAVYDAYNDDYQATVNAVPYNREYKKTFIEGSNNLCELVPLSNKKGTKYIHLTTKSNMLVGVNQTGEEEKIEVERFKAFVLQFIATMFFGVQFETISPEKFMVAKMSTDEPI